MTFTFQIKSNFNNIKVLKKKKRKLNITKERKNSYKWSQYCSICGGEVWAGNWVQLLLQVSNFISLESLQFIV